MNILDDPQINSTGANHKNIEADATGLCSEAVDYGHSVLHNMAANSVNYPTLLALTRSLRVGLPGSATRFFTDGRLAPTVRAGSAVSAGVDLERPTPTRW